MKRTYEDAIGALTRAVFAATEFDALYTFIEHGVVGIREMTNLELAQEWDTYFADELDLIDPESNPNGEGDSLLF